MLDYHRRTSRRSSFVGNRGTSMARHSREQHRPLGPSARRIRHGAGRRPPIRPPNRAAVAEPGYLPMRPVEIPVAPRRTGTLHDALRRRLHPGAGIGPPAHRRAGAGHRPPGHAADRLRVDPRRAALPVHAPRGGLSAGDESRRPGGDHRLGGAGREAAALVARGVDVVGLDVLGAHGDEGGTCGRRGVLQQRSPGARASSISRSIA